MGEFEGVRNRSRFLGAARHGTMLVAVSLLLGACSSVPDAVNPAEWYKSTVDLFSGGDKSVDPDEEARRAREQKVAEAAGTEQGQSQFPKVSDVEKQRQARNLGLSADPDRPRYAPAIPRQDQAAVADALTAQPAPAAPPAPAPAPAAKPAAAEQAAKPQAPSGLQLKKPKDSLTPPGEPELATSFPGVPQVDVPTRAQQEAEYAGLQNRMQKRLAEILAAAGEQPKFVRPSTLPAGIGVGETMVISGEGVSGGEGGAAAFTGMAADAEAAGVPLPAGATRVATIVFPNGSSKLSVRDRQILAQVVALQKERGGTIHVVGHSSSRTRNMSPDAHRAVNYKMSVLRADTVAKELVRRGAAKGSVVTAALADSQPIYQETMPNGEAGNRRAEIYLTN